MSHAFPPPSLLDADPQTAALIAAEERRQREKIILIPSESLTPPAVREALGSALTSVYAEGYPRKAMTMESPEELADIDGQLASYRRYADRRFYKGAEIANLVESLAIRRAAECFATEDFPSERIFANVQALSGAAANLAVYEAFVQPGDTVMGMALTEGGHLTHGSPFSVTGRRYNIVSYSVDPSTGKLDYDAIEQLAEAHRPKLIIGGFTSYPWQPDWERFRAIADRVGAILLADIAHTAGMVVGGVYPNPVGIAHVSSFTTHKTLCGPRGAIILSTDPEIASQIDSSIFPGQQGGPHVNKFAAIAVALKLAQSPAFADLQRRIVENATFLADSLREHGLHIAYGGTNTHLLLVDLRELVSETGFVMMGEVASRILELAGIVCNKNTLPGDTSAADAHGIRLGTPWATQRGFGEEQMRELGRIIADVLHAIQPFEYVGLMGQLSRGKLPLDALGRAKVQTLELIASVDSSLPLRSPASEPSLDDPTWVPLRLRGGRVRALLNEATTIDLFSLPQDEARRTYLFDGEGVTLCEAIVGRLAPEDYVVLVPREQSERAIAWLVGLAEGYTLFDPADIFRKVQGPAVVEEMAPADLPESILGWLDAPSDAGAQGRSIADAFALHPERFALHKPYFVGQSSLVVAPVAETKERFDGADQKPAGDLRKTALHESHVQLGARMVPFAGWEMPVWYTSTLDEHKAIREQAGLFDLGHMGVFQVEGEGATEFLNAATSNYAAWLEDGTSQYGYLFDAEGNVLDDIFVYRRALDRYLVVVNAANEDKDWAWLNGLNEGRYAIDAAHPERRIATRVRLRDLKKERGVIDIALQGPQSSNILEKLLDPANRRTLRALERTEFCELVAEGHQMIVARTGYTGETVGYEIYVGERSSRWLWDRLLDVGKEDGITPCGLAARDSARTEAGFPLYGHELAGEHDVNPFEAGFGSYVKLHKPFFVGRTRCVDQYTHRRRAIIRFSVEPGARPVRAGAAVIDASGSYLGRVTSCVIVGKGQIGLAIVEKKELDPGTPIALIAARGYEAKAVGDLAQGDRVSAHVRATVVPRFRSAGAMGNAGGD